MKQIGNMTLDEVLAELDALGDEDDTTPDDDDAKTISEWADLLGIDRHECGKRIQRAVSAGKMRAVRRVRRYPSITRRVICFEWVSNTQTGKTGRT